MRTTFEGAEGATTVVVVVVVAGAAAALITLPAISEPPIIAAGTHQSP